MNWSKIKKTINNSLEKPLDELINSKIYATKYENKTPISNEVTTTNNNWTTVIEVSGQGMAAFTVMSVILSNRFASVKITVDGTVIDEEEDDNLAGVRPRIYGVSNSGHNHDMIGNWGLGLGHDDEDEFFSVTIPRNIPLPINAFIGFNNSIKYEIKRAEGGTNIKGKAVVVS